MKISDLKIGQEKVNVEGNVKEVGEIRSFNKFGRQVRVANAVLEDDSGSIKLTLWNNDIDNVKKGDKVKISNGFVNEFQGEKQLTAGKFGKMEVLGEGKGKKEKAEKAEEETEKAEEETEDEDIEEESEEAEETGEEF